MARTANPSLIYGLAGLLSLPGPFLRSSIGEGDDLTQQAQAFPFVFYVLPLAAASLALAFSHRRRGTRGVLDTVVAALWLVTVVTASLPPILWPPPMGQTLAESVLVAITSLGLATSALLLLRSGDSSHPVYRLLQSGGTALLALQFARGAAGIYLSATATQSAGIARMMQDAQLFAAVVVTAALMIAGGAAGHRGYAERPFPSEPSEAPTS
jgi:hypothetical protein